MATAQHRRLPTADQLHDWNQHAGLTDICVTHLTRPMNIDADILEQRVRAEIPHRYPEISTDELTAGLQQLRADQQQHDGPWHEPRTHTVVIAKRTPHRSATGSAPTAGL
jgi:hypothetical protein